MKKIILITLLCLANYILMAQIYTPNTTIQGNSTNDNVSIGITPFPYTPMAPLDIKGSGNFTDQGWSYGIRLITKDTGTLQHAPAIIWDKGNSTRPFHFFMAGPADNPNGDFFSGFVSSYNGTPIYTNSYSSAVSGVNPIGTAHFYKNLIVNNTTARVGIGLDQPTEQLHTTQGVRFEGLTNNTLATRYVVADNTGKLFYNTGGVSGINNNCNVLNYVTKVDANGTDITCSQIYDDGTNVGINTYIYPVTKLHVNGQSLWLQRGDCNQLSNTSAGLRMFYNSDNDAGDIFAYNYDSEGNNGPKNLILQTPCGERGGNIGIGLYQPTEQLHTTDGVRFEGLIDNPSVRKVVVWDNNGKLWTRDFPSSGGGVTNNCTTTNLIPKVDASGTGNLTCSQIIDNGTSVGIGINPTSTPRTKLHVNGQSLWLTGGNGNNFGFSNDPNLDKGLRMYFDGTYGQIFAHDYYNGQYKDLILQIPGGSSGSGNVGIGMAPGNWTGGYALAGGNPNNPTNVKLDVNGLIRSTYLIVTSDERYKKDIKKLDNSLNKILSLTGVSYNWRKDEFKDKNFDNFRQNGYIAQLVEKIIPEAVGKDEKGFYGVNYNAIIPVITEAMKEQQELITNLQNEVKELQNQLSSKQTSTSINIKTENICKLYQNNPNPFNESTSISFYLADNVKKATLYVYNMQGIQLKRFEIETRGNGKIIINGGEFDAGMYLYSLVVDGKDIDTKRMMLTK